MNTYIDQNYLVAHDTIISYSGNESHVDIPQLFDKIRLNKIGDGAFSELTGIESIKLPYGVSYIGEAAFKSNSKLKKIEIPGTVKSFSTSAFYGCVELSEIIWYDIELSEDEYNVLKGGCSSAYDGILVSNYIPKFVKESGFKGIGNTYGEPAATIVPKSIPALFKHNTKDNGRSQQELFANIEKIPFSEVTIDKNEHDAFIEHINSSDAEPLSSISENINDYAIKTEKPLVKEQTYIVLFDDKLTKKKGEKIYITAILKFGYFFWQSKQKIICDKKDYYVYRRHYLSTNPEIEYIREDAAIYCRKRLVTDRKEAQRVYGKYKLLSIL